MDIIFDRGSAPHPKGHALAYFRISTEPDKVYATYVVVLPIKADLAKYVPPFLASHLGNVPLSDFSAFAMPPVPEEIESYQSLMHLSEMRDDDLVYGGSMFSFDLPRMMSSVSELVQAYSQMCTDHFRETSVAESRLHSGQNIDERAYQVNEVLFGLMSEVDKLTELARLLGKLRFGLDGQDANSVNEVADEVTVLARHLPKEYHLASLLAAARDSSNEGARLAQLYLDRCFRLSAGDILAAQALDDQIQDFNS
jgi:hypothetical protein